MAKLIDGLTVPVWDGPATATSDLPLPNASVGERYLTQSYGSYSWKIPLISSINRGTVTQNADIYVPTTPGDVNQVLMGAGTGASPVWKNFSTTYKHMFELVKKTRDESWIQIIWENSTESELSLDALIEEVNLQFPDSPPYRSCPYINGIMTFASDEAMVPFSFSCQQLDYQTKALVINGAQLVNKKMVSSYLTSNSWNILRQYIL